MCDMTLIRQAKDRINKMDNKVQNQILKHDLTIYIIGRQHTFIKYYYINTSLGKNKQSVEFQVKFKTYFHHAK